MLHVDLQGTLDLPWRWPYDAQPYMLATVQPGRIKGAATMRLLHSGRCLPPAYLGSGPPCRQVSC